MYNLLLFERTSRGVDQFRKNITALAQGWHRTTRAMGGYYQGDFAITQEQLSRGELVDLYNNAIGWRLIESSYGVTTWEGEIVEVRLTLDGIEYTRSLNPELWMNKVAVIYPAGQTAWSEDTDSSDIYGESCYIDTVPAPYDATASEARRDRRLIEYAFPRSWATGGLSKGDPDIERGASLAVFCAGYVFSINRRYRETDTAADDLDDQIAVLVGESEFVTMGYSETNTLQVPISTEGIPTRLWDLIEELIGFGDASGNDYVGGVYADREFRYEAAETDVTHYWRDQTLYDSGGKLVLPTHIKPNIMVEITNAPRSQAILGATTKDQPNRFFIDEVEFIAPDSYRLTPRYGLGTGAWD